jgi:transposase InsO family protein
MISSADDAFSSNSPFSSSPPQLQSRSSPRLITIHGIDEIEKWSSSAVLLFIQAKILNDLFVLKLRCVPPHAKDIATAEAVHWKRSINLKVLNELKLAGLHHPPPFAPVVAAPSEMKFVLPDYSAATGSAKEKSTLLKEAKALHDRARADHEAEVLANAVRLDAFNENSLKNHQDLMIKFNQERDSMHDLLLTQHIHEARLSVWLQLLPSLGESFYKINETVDFAMPAQLIKAIESAVFRNEDGEREQLQLQFWNATLAEEGRGDPYQLHRFILLAGRKLAVLNNEPIRDGDMRSVLIKALPDEIFIGFKTGLHNHPSGSKTFNDVFNILKIYSASSSAKPLIDDLIRRCARQYSKPVPAGVFVSRASTRSPPTTLTQQPCYDFAKGKCARGRDCKFAHAPGSTAPATKTLTSCSHCSKTGHLPENCFLKFPEKRRARNGSAAAPKAQQAASRATNFLLDIRKNVEELLLEDSDNHEAQADCFMFTTVPSVLPALSAAPRALAAPISPVSAANVSPSVFSAPTSTSVQCSELMIHTKPRVIQKRGVNQLGVSVQDRSLSPSLEPSLILHTSTVCAPDSDEELHSMDSSILFPTEEELTSFAAFPSLQRTQQLLRSSAFTTQSDYLQLESGSRVYLPTSVDISSTSRLQRFVQRTDEAAASTVVNKRAANTGVKKRKPSTPPNCRATTHVPLILPTNYAGDSDDEDPPELVSSTDDTSDDSDEQPKRKSNTPRARKSAGANFTTGKFTRGEYFTGNPFISSVPSKRGDSGCEELPDLLDSSSSESGEDSDALPDLAPSDSSGSEGDDEPHDHHCVAAGKSHLLASVKVLEPSVVSTPLLMIKDSQAVLNIAGVDASRVLVDGGATIHATSSIEHCFDVHPCSVSIAGVGGLAFNCRKKGKLLFQPTGRTTPITLLDVHIAQEFPATFISESSLVRKGCSILKNASGGTVTNDKTGLLFQLEEKDGLYYAVGHLVMPPANLLVLSGPAPPAVPFECSDVGTALSWLVKCDLGVDNQICDELHSLLLSKVYSKREVSDLLGRYHRRMSHISFKRVAAAFGIELPANFEPPMCNACVIGKQQNVPHHEGARLRSTRPCAGLHIDFCGPFPHTSVTGNRYLLIFKCDFTGYVWDFYTRHQSEFFDIFVALVKRLSNQFSVKNVVVWIRSDNGKVFTEGRLAEYCLQKGIRHEFSAPHSQWQNGSAESMFNTILNLSVASLHQSGLVRGYWEDATRLAVLCIDRIGEPANVNIQKGFPAGYSRLERMHSLAIPTRLNGIYPLGVMAFARVPAELRRKFDARAIPCIYLGLHDTIKGARLLQLDANKVSVAATFTICEGHFPLMASALAAPSKEFLKEHSVRDMTESPTIVWPPASSSNDFHALINQRDSAAQPTAAPSSRPSRQWAPSSQALQNIAAAADVVDRRTHAGNEDLPEGNSDLRPVLVVSPSVEVTEKKVSADAETLRFINPVTPWICESDDFLPETALSVPVILTASLAFPVAEVPCSRHEYLAQTPTTHARAMASPHKEFWEAAEMREVIAHIKNDTFGPLLDFPPGVSGSLPINSVYRNKFTGEGKVIPSALPPEFFKARIVILGYLMVLGRDYEETFAPTAAPTSIRMLAVLATRLRLLVKAADVETAFLVPKMDKVVYVKALLWYEQIVASINKLPVPTILPPRACRQLLKGVPGIKQGSRLFYQEVAKCLLANGFIIHPTDACVFIRLPTALDPFLLAAAIWVDDVFALVASDDEWKKLLAILRTVFTVVDKGDIKLFLGMEILQSSDRATITFSQRIHIDNLLSRAKASMKSLHPAPTPCVAGFIFTKADCPTVPQPRPLRMPEFRGHTALASFIAVWTRVECVYTVNKCCKYQANPGDKHIDAFERLLRYLIGTRNLGLVYTYDDSAAPVVAYSDSSHMDCVDTSRSTLAYLIFFYNQVVAWYSKLHSFVTTCSNHSEYAAMFQAAKEAQSIFNWLTPFLPLLGATVVPIPIFNDNDGASALAKDPVNRFKNKHVNMQHHYTQELVKAGVVVPVRVDTSENKSDLLTKALGPTVFPKLAATLVGSIEPPAHHVLMFKAVSSGPEARVQPLRVADVGTQCDFDEGLASESQVASPTLASDIRTALAVFNAEVIAVTNGLAAQQNYCERMRLATAQLRTAVYPHLPADRVEARPSIVAQTFIARSPRESLANSRSRQHNELIAPPRRHDDVAPTGRYCLNCRKRNHDTAQCRHILNYSDRTHLKRGR